MSTPLSAENMPAPSDRDQLTEETARKIRQLSPWFHNLHLPDGSQTVPDHFLGDFPAYKWRDIRRFLPQDMHGMQVLDIGCNAGYYSFQLAALGAQVTALDSDDHYLAQARWAATMLDTNRRVRFQKASIYHLGKQHRKYDLVWFMGVFYHLRYPLLALDIVRNCCSGRIIFQTMTVPGDAVYTVKKNYPLDQRTVMNEPGWPKMAFIEHRFAEDPTNWWSPNHAAVEAMLRSAGFSNIERISHEIYAAQVLSLPAQAVSRELQSVVWQQ